jgi:phosphatidylglycerol:prolipoprotein diacylglycerol transferase
MIVVSFLVGMWLVRKRAKLYGFNPDKVLDMGFWALIAGVLGARIAFILQELPYYLKHQNELFSLQFSGLTSFGGEILAVIAIVLWAKRNKYGIVPILDLAAPGYVLGYAIGRIGCFLNGCCYGGVCSPNLPWGVHFADAQGLHHPAQLYDTLMNLVALGILLMAEKRKLLSGRLAALTLILHGAARFIYEFWRAGTEEEVQKGLASSTYWGSLPITQGHAMALVLIVIGAVWYVIAGKKAVKTPPSDHPEMNVA